MSDTKLAEKDAHRLLRLRAPKSGKQAREIHLFCNWLFRTPWHSLQIADHKRKSCSGSTRPRLCGAGYALPSSKYLQE